jgi:hypothetical protein
MSQSVLVSLLQMREREVGVIGHWFGYRFTLPASYLPAIPQTRLLFLTCCAFTNQTRTRAAQPRSSRCGLVARVERRLEACELGYLSLQQPTFRRCCEVRRTTWCHFGLDRTALRSLWYVRARTTDSSWIRNQHAASALSSPLAEIHLRMSENAS